MTNDVIKYYSATSSPAEEIGSKEWKSTVRIYRRDNNLEVVDKFDSYGTTCVSAMVKRLKLAKERAKKLGKPSDWMNRIIPPNPVFC
jgi:intein-encoded DNA endonuclease-like protein